MGVDVTNYLVFGFKGNPQELKKHQISIWDEKFLQYSEGHPGIIDTLIKDDNNQYFIFGRRLNYLHDNDDRIHTIPYQHIRLIEETQRLTDQFIELFGKEIYQTLEIKEPQLMNFNHFH